MAPNPPHTLWQHGVVVRDPELPEPRIADGKSLGHGSRAVSVAASPALEQRSGPTAHAITTFIGPRSGLSRLAEKGPKADRAKVSRST